MSMKAFAADYTITYFHSCAAVNTLTVVGLITTNLGLLRILFTAFYWPIVLYLDLGLLVFLMTFTDFLHNFIK